ncbi:alpha/beta hydrolase [Actinoallomurus spadix]|uniref:Alpha/beta hydrolase n=1 Tax=Actinoallomurus spadix TaxID=79912 RepID=A0ABN0XQW0_9ACTN|nr:alpha/beta hydrolase [Actinoallomurus spadix]MCO5988346.1 alpha/beta hydrolase [Actinoallomurus spadix]
MAAFETGRLTVPGASLHYEVRGTGPLLLLIAAGSSDATAFEGLAAALAARHRVVSYDPRGNSRSALHGPPVDQRIEVHADDAARLIDHVATGGEPVRVFGSCSGGLVALDLVIGQPDRVQRVVVHEPPAMALLPDADEHRAFFDDVHALFGRAGVAAALKRFGAVFGGSPAPALPRAYDNDAFFLAHAMRPFTRHVPDLTALEAIPERVVMAGGEDSRTYAVHRPAVALARRLGHRPVLFPGGHMGYAKHPVAFAGRLAEVLAATAPPRER